MIPPSWWQYGDKPTHSEILRSISRHRCIAAARRSGKTALLQTIAASAASEGRAVLYVTLTYAMCRELLFDPVRWALGGRVIRADRSDLSLSIRGGGTIWCKSCERPELLLGRGLDDVLLDEAQSMPDLLYDAVVRPLVATTGGRLVAAGTPRGTENLLHRFFHLGQRGLDDWMSWHLTAYEAGTIPREEVEHARLEAERAGPTAQKLWKREWMADFASFVGQVYPGWDPARMVVDAPPPGHPSRVVAGLDWGFSVGHAGVIEVCALHGTVWYVVDEISAEGRSMDWWVPQIGRILRTHGVRTVYCDPSQRASIQLLQREVRKSGPGPWAQFVEADNAVEDGVLCVATLMDRDELRVIRRCEQLRRRIPGYVWDSVSAGGMAGTFREKPRKLHDNELDALRYALFTAARRVQPRPF